MKEGLSENVYFKVNVYELRLTLSYIASNYPKPCRLPRPFDCKRAKKDINFGESTNREDYFHDEKFIYELNHSL